MELTGSRTIPAPQQATWDALDDPATLKACVAGCESMERTDDGALAAVVAMRIGPVSARFKGRLARTDVDAPNGCTMAFDGQGGVAGFGKGTAIVRLSPAEGGAATALAFEAKATVGGKLAQIGSRLVDAAAAKVADDFFAAFEAVMRERHAAAAVDAAGAAPADAPVETSAQTPEPTPAQTPSQTPSTSTSPPPTGTLPSAPPPVPTGAMPAAGAEPFLPPPRPRAPARARQPGETSDWVIAAVVVVATVFLVFR